MAFTFSPDLKTVTPDGGNPFLTEQAALDAGVLKNPNYNSALPNSISNPYYSNVAFPSTGGTVPASTVVSATSGQGESLSAMATRLRSEAGLPAMQSAQQNLLQQILSTKTAGKAGIANEEGRTNALAPSIGARQEQIQKDVATIVQPLVDTYNLNAQQIQSVEERIKSDVGLVQAQNAQDISLLNALNDIPEGQSVTIGGKTFTGVKKIDADTQVLANESGIYLVNKANGTIKELQSFTPKSETSKVEADGRVWLIDNATGNKIKDLGAISYKPDSTGGAMSPLDMLRLAQYEGLTQVAPGQIVNAAGQAAKLNESQITNFQRYDQYLNTLIPTVSVYLDPKSPEKVETGGAVGRYMTTVQNLPLVQRTLSEQQNKLMADIATMNNQLIYMLSGKQINESEYTRLKAQLPDVTLTNEQNMTRINEFGKLMTQARDKQLQLMGLHVASTKEANVSSSSDTSTDGDYQAYLKAIGQ